jgi:hypothetical protein
MAGLGAAKMTIYRKYTAAEIDNLADDLKQQLSEGILPEGWKSVAPPGE